MPTIVAIVFQLISKCGCQLSNCLLNCCSVTTGRCNTNATVEDATSIVEGFVFLLFKRMLKYLKTKELATTDL
jgi:hypothetical protein